MTRAHAAIVLSAIALASILLATPANAISFPLLDLYEGHGLVSGTGELVLQQLVGGPSLGAGEHECRDVPLVAIIHHGPIGEWSLIFQSTASVGDGRTPDTPLVEGCNADSPGIPVTGSPSTGFHAQSPGPCPYAYTIDVGPLGPATPISIQREAPGPQSLGCLFGGGIHANGTLDFTPFVG